MWQKFDVGFVHIMSKDDVHMLKNAVKPPPKKNKSDPIFPQYNFFLFVRFFLYQNCTNIMSNNIFFELVVPCVSLHQI